MACFFAADNVIFDALFDCFATGVHKGDVVVKQDTLCFYVKDAEEAAEEVTAIYRCRQVEAKKKTGTGEAILSGDRLYYIVAEDKVSANYSGVAGTDYYFCGWANEDASANAEDVLMNYDGTRHTEAGR